MLIHRSPVDNYRSLLRKFNYAQGRSSFPFISGDTYASLCGAVYSRYFDFAKSTEDTTKKSLFLPAFLKDIFLDELRELNAYMNDWILVIHNYDNIPAEEEIVFLSAKFKRVYCVNWLGDKQVATPIPIGLENWSHLRNGVPRDFKNSIWHKDIPFERRPIKVLSSFSASTNLTERNKALQFARSFPETFQMSAFSSPAKYRETVRGSKFVISPPGNGADCHRTWEALYLGAVPIVLRTYWPFEHIDLPVLVVDDWEQVPQLIDQYEHTGGISIDQLKKLFLEF